LETDVPLLALRSADAAYFSAVYAAENEPTLAQHQPNVATVGLS